MNKYGWIHRFFRKDNDFIYNALPMILAIAISGFMDVQNSLHNPMSAYIDKLVENANLRVALKRFLWSLIQIIPAFSLGLFSDHHHRVNALRITHALGIVSIILMSIFGIETWVFLVIGLMFNPFSICRAALLDNYPQISAIVVISITFIAKNISWIFIDILPRSFSKNSLIFIGIVLSVNLIILLFKTSDRYENALERKKLESQARANLINYNRLPIFLSIIGLSFAEASFYALWILLEAFGEAVESWIKATTMSAFFGVLLTMFFIGKRKIQDLNNSISALYLIAAIAGLVGIFYFEMLGIPFQVNHICIISIIGGIYLPLVSDYLISAAGSERKATGSVFSELSDTIALIFASTITSIMYFIQLNIFVLFVVAFSLAALLQAISEKRVIYRLPK